MQKKAPPRGHGAARAFQLTLYGEVDSAAASCTVYITGSSGVFGDITGITLESLEELGEDNKEKAVQPTGSSFRSQFVKALRPVNGDDDDAVEADAKDWAIHFVALPWKLFFAFVPPVHIFGGWACFCVALIFIGLVTALIGDWAALLGCVVGLPDSITAITIVALGTSLPDTFASKVAAVEDPTADNAIGNVTGSNAVNVFLGLGLPWAMASVFWHATGRTPEWDAKYPDMISKYPDGGFVVMAGDLTFSVVVFIIAALLCLGVLIYRRKAFGCELGGPAGAKLNTSIFFVLLWLYYVSLASWKTLRGNVETIWLVVAPLFGGVIVIVTLLCMTIVIAFYMRMQTAKQKELESIIKATQGPLPDLKNFKSVKEAAALLRRQIQVLSDRCADLEAQAAVFDERMQKDAAQHQHLPPKQTAATPLLHDDEATKKTLMPVAKKKKQSIKATGRGSATALPQLPEAESMQHQGLLAERPEAANKEDEAVTPKVVDAAPDATAPLVSADLHSNAPGSGRGDPVGLESEAALPGV
eukprot:TRINITY_DN9781_c0_g1_i10.p1 TRINITY_DN9781_c0_g1~~TRINITY_DN9781_c0_g1_i10.p1  ORF type:complete len:530 (+),score=162.40 TRINITY_DN9781_c0_g1_i10:256-1845(+)